MQFVNHPRQNVSQYGHSQVYEDLKRIHHICLDRLDQTPPARDSIPLGNGQKDILFRPAIPAHGMPPGNQYG